MFKIFVFIILLVALFLCAETVLYDTHQIEHIDSVTGKKTYLTITIIEILESDTLDLSSYEYRCLQLDTLSGY